MTVACIDCGAEVRRAAASTVTAMSHFDDGGYETFQAPACRRCALKRRGHECEHCGELHMDIEAAMRCCVGETKAPDCPECGRRMGVGAAGYHPDHGQEITVAECECCPVMWGRFTGWEMTDDGPCKHLDAEPDTPETPEKNE